MKITVFTPTYNRSNTLERLYNSLTHQDDSLFEWLVIDDGSTDDTISLLKKFKNNASFSMRYLYQTNGGKHRAHNLAVKEAKGELMIIVDSDDELLPDAISIIWDEWDSISLKERKFYSGIWGNCVDNDQKIIGKNLPKNSVDGSLFQLTSKGIVSGEKLPCFRIDILKEFFFPELEGNTECVPEGVCWIPISEKYKIRFIDQPLRIYHKDENDVNALINKSINPKYGAWGKMLFSIVIINFCGKYFPSYLLIFFKSSINISRFCLHTNIPLSNSINNINSLFAKVITMLLIPIGVGKYFLDFLRK